MGGGVSSSSMGVRAPLMMSSNALVIVRRILNSMRCVTCASDPTRDTWLSAACSVSGGEWELGAGWVSGTEVGEGGW